MAATGPLAERTERLVADLQLSRNGAIGSMWTDRHAGTREA